MNTTTVTADLPRAHRQPRWSPRLVSAEFLKLRKRRGLVLTSLALTAVPMLIAYTVLLSRDGAAGGLENFAGSMDLLWGMSVVAAILVGSTLGTGDLGAGVFRELVVTGRSRLALFAARVPAGLGVLLPIVGIGFAITATGATIFAGSQETRAVHGILDLGDVAPSASLLLQSAGWLALVTAVSFVLALGVSSLLGSRGTSIGILLGWYLVAMPLLLEYGQGARLTKGLFIAATDRLKPEALLAGATPAVSMSLAAAVVVLLAWTLVPLGIGAWRTCTRDA
jgi:hypothetical protein